MDYAKRVYGLQNTGNIVVKLVCPPSHLFFQLVKLSYFTPGRIVNGVAGISIGNYQIYRIIPSICIYNVAYGGFLSRTVNDTCVTFFIMYIVNMPYTRSMDRCSVMQIGFPPPLRLHHIIFHTTFLSWQRAQVHISDIIESPYTRMYSVKRSVYLYYRAF